MTVSSGQQGSCCQATSIYSSDQVSSCTSIAGHRCLIKGCGYTIVVDGNMKNHRDVCFAGSAGFVEYKGLPGRVRSGCPNTPEFKSCYCKLHMPTVATPSKKSESDEAETSSTTVEDQVGLIVGKRETRNCTLYEVHCKHVHTCIPMIRKQMWRVQCL